MDGYQYPSGTYGRVGSQGWTYKWSWIDGDKSSRSAASIRQHRPDGDLDGVGAGNALTERLRG